MLYNRHMYAILVEDDRENASFVSKGLKDQGFTCVIAPDGETGWRKMLAEPFDIAIVDIRLPGMSGFELIRRLREVGNRIPIVVLSALDQPGDKICGLNIGADDYLAKPFALNELIARVNALLRRTTGRPAEERIVIRDLVVDTVARKAFRNGNDINLTPREYCLLEYLVRNARRTVTVKMILREVWKYDSTPLTKVVEARMCLLRKKLCQGGEDELIHTVRGFGYVLK